MFHLEPLTGGLVTARDASLLSPGELTAALNGIYRPFNAALSPIRGRAAFGSAVGAAVRGLRATPFEGFGLSSTRLVIAHGTIWQTGIGASWTTFRTGLAADRRLEAVAFENQYFLTNGSDVSVVFGGATFSGHGMQPTEENDTLVSLVAGGGAWNESGGPATGLYFYWITEYDSVNDIESAYTSVVGGDAVDVVNDDDTVRVAIQYGQAAYLTLHNANATHWRVYRDAGPGTLAVTPSNFPSGFRLGEVAIPGAPAITNFDDTGIVSNTPYNFLSLSIAGGPALLIQRDTVPPIWSTGDIFEDSLVTNDVAEPSVVRYSFPGKPHSFPSLYFVGFNTKQQDEVTCIRSLDAVCIVGMQGQVWRLNYLPNETDSEFSRGRCREIISASSGIVGPDAACIFTPVEGNSRVAYVSHDGLYMTDGLRTQLLTMDIDWDTLVDKTALSGCLLVNVQHLYSLFFYFVANGSGGLPNNRALHLSYHPQHLKEGGYLKVSGPSSLEAWAADYSGNSFRAFAGSTAATVMEEDVTAGVSTMTAQTRLIYPREGSIDTETRIDEVRILVGAFTGGTFDVALRRRKSDADIFTDASAVFVPSATENRLVSLHVDGRAEAYGAVLHASADLHYIGFKTDVTQR